ncbi:MAG: nickel pincer cofactor biosynthesis protein LarB [Gammaproteobacteria bacterium]|nr:nickel pincer cofactor biosynthesis protein LarB [Gammaproteobacteria bacterium]
MADQDHVPDIRREERLGFDEAVFCLHKQTGQLQRIIEQALSARRSLLLTRLAAHQLEALPESQRARIDYHPLSLTGICGERQGPKTPPRIALVSAGTSDAAVAAEATRTLAYYGEACVRFQDVGVAGLWRLLERVEEIRRMPIVIAVAGMDAALPSVVAGLVPGLVVAVPVSTGYGVAAQGQAALNAALASCAPGLVVVNIDNGYGAACAALRAVRALDSTAGAIDSSGGGTTA